MSFYFNICLNFDWLTVEDERSYPSDCNSIKTFVRRCSMFKIDMKGKSRFATDCAIMALSVPCR